ncbi:hypothetical protein WJX74_008343 [Apatococcus lobatus]|uniref:AAA+ ATPase domain-containing protein n=1 Tax=Apatococcus lobatus TaxID=904363 RepID=A0AAW1S431_9CHLO
MFKAHTNREQTKYGWNWPAKPRLSRFRDVSQIYFNLREGSEFEYVMAEVAAQFCSTISSGVQNNSERSIHIESTESYREKETTFSSSNFPGLEFKVSMTKSPWKRYGVFWDSFDEPEIRFCIYKNKALTPADLQFIGAALKAANKLPVAEENGQLPADTAKDPIWGTLRSSGKSKADADALDGQTGAPEPPAPTATDTLKQQLQSLKLCLQDKDEKKGDAAEPPKVDAASAAIGKLQSLGATVYKAKGSQAMDWNVLAGYEEQKYEIEDTLLLTLQQPAVHENIKAGTRLTPGRILSRALLLEGPPGCGKTSTARVVASQAGLPLVHISMESILSKWYGQEDVLASIIKATELLPGCVVFLDGLEAIASTRTQHLYSGSHRLLGALLPQLDSLAEQGKTVVIGNTSRKQEMDPALLGRFDSCIAFALPSISDRLVIFLLICLTDSCTAKLGDRFEHHDSHAQSLGISQLHLYQILKQLAKHLDDRSIAAIARATTDMSGRDLRDLCESAERRWASKIIRHGAGNAELPPRAEYLASVLQRSREKETPLDTA